MKMVQVTLRIPESWRDRADKLVDRLSTRWLPVNRMDAIRAAIARGLEEFEKDVETAKDPTPAAAPARARIAEKFGFPDPKPPKETKEQGK